MKRDIAVGAGVVGMMALCCGAPIIISVLASGAVLGALGTLWSAGRVALLSGAAVLLLAGIWLVARRNSTHRSGAADCCAVPPSTDVTVEPEAAPDAERSPALTGLRSDHH
jgi:hypothetical protein